MSYFKGRKRLFADRVSANKKLLADSGVPIEKIKKNTLRWFVISANNLIIKIKLKVIVQFT